MATGNHVSAPDFVAVGHICCDLVNSRKILGAPASYSSLTARALGCSVGVVTAYADDFPFRDTFEGISIENIGSASTTMFRNIYRNGVREQYVSAVADPIHARHIPGQWAFAPTVYLCPIAGEVMPDVAKRFSDSLIGIGAQGWLRVWDESGRVRKKRWEDAASVVSNVNMVVYSELDLDEPYKFAEDISRLTPIVIVTQASRGAELFVEGRRLHIPAYEVRAADETGAGDVFGAAFLVKYRECRDPVEAARFACCAASFVCEREGTEGIPTLEQVLSRMRERAAQT